MSRELQATNGSPGKPEPAAREVGQPLAQQEDDGWWVVCGRKTAEDLGGDLLTPSPPPPTPPPFQLTENPVQFENGNPLFYLTVILWKGNYLSGQQSVPSLSTVQQEPKRGCQLRTWTPGEGPFACRTSDQQHFNIHHTKSREQEPSNVSLCENES
jgi:hypothetical protein